MAYGVMIPATSYAGLPFPPPVARADIAPDAMLFADRHEMTTALVYGVVAEVGSYLGAFAEHLLDGCETSELHIFERDVKRIGPVKDDDRVTLHAGDSSTEMAKVSDDFFDAIYIDGDHSLAGVAKDAAVGARKVRPGGLIICNDYTLWSVIEEAPYGICHAVGDLLGAGFHIVGFAFQFQGYPDIALRRPT